MNILAIDSSAAQEGSVSRILVDHALALLLQAHPGATVVRRERSTDDCQHAAEQPMVDPQAVYVGAGKWVELNRSHIVCVIGCAGVATVRLPIDLRRSDVFRSWLELVI